MKTLKEEVMELLMKRIGVIEDEEFKASTIDRGCDTYKISKDKLFFNWQAGNDKCSESANSRML